MPRKGKGGSKSTPGGGIDPMLAQLLAGAAGGAGGSARSARDQEFAEIEAMMEQTKGMDFNFGPKPSECDMNSDVEEDTLTDEEKFLRQSFEKAYKQSKILQDMKFTTVSEYKVLNPNWKKADYFASGGFSKAAIDWSVTCTIRSVPEPNRARCVRYKGRMVLRKVGFTADDDETSENTIVVGHICCTVLKPCNWDRVKPGSKGERKYAETKPFDSLKLAEDFPELYLYTKFNRKLSCRRGMLENSRWVNHVNDDFGELTQNETAFIDSVQVEEAFRGTGAGLFMVEEANKAINSAMSLTLIPVRPIGGLFEDGTMGEPTVVPEYKKLQHSSSEGSGSETKSSADSAENAEFGESLVKRLRQLYSYYGRVGFKLIGNPSRQEDLFLAHWNGCMSPDIDKVVPHWF